MWIYAGIDEAGYGPLLGPLVVARSVFEVEGAASEGALPSLWMAMRRAVCRRAGDKLKRVAVNDSKLLYNRTIGVRHLERGVLGFMRAAAMCPGNLAEILELVGLDAESREITLDWYRDAAGGPALPSCVDSRELERCAGSVACAWDQAGVRLVDVNAAVVFEDRFNCMVRDSRSKAACSWRFVAAHLQAVWETFGSQRPRVVVDRQGGRQKYLDLLATLFPWMQVRLIERTARGVSYEVSHDGRAMEISFVVESEADHLPVAFASMTAKYLRELLMGRYAAFFRAHAPDVRSSAGYSADGRRFLREIAPALEQLGIDRSALVRVR